MKNPVFRGSSVAIVTPFAKNGSVDFDKLAQLIDYQIENGTAAITICGTTGEASTQTTPEHLKTIEYCVNHVNGRVPVIAGTGSNDTAHALEMSLSAKESGADALLIVTPYYNKTSQHGLIKHFTYIADRVDLPMILYNVPGRTGMSISPATYKELSKHPNINGVKEASGNFSLIAQVRSLCGDNLNVWSGNDEQVVPILSLGGHGVISVAANIIPSVMSEICKLYFDGKTKESADLMLNYMTLLDALFVEVNPVPVKTALNLMGFDVGKLRMPLCEMASANLTTLKNAMLGANIKLVQ